MYDNLSLNALLKSKANYYGFNVVDIHEQYKKWGLLQFYNTTDAYHQIYALMCLVGQRIIESFDEFKSPKPRMGCAEDLPFCDSLSC